MPLVRPAAQIDGYCEHQMVGRNPGDVLVVDVS